MKATKADHGPTKPRHRVQLLDAYLFTKQDAENIRAAAGFILQVCTDAGQQGEGERVKGELDAIAQKIESTLPKIILHK